MSWVDAVYNTDAMVNPKSILFRNDLNRRVALMIKIDSSNVNAAMSVATYG